MSSNSVCRKMNGPQKLRSSNPGHQRSPVRTPADAPLDDTVTSHLAEINTIRSGNPVGRAQYDTAIIDQDAGQGRFCGRDEG